MKKHSTTPASSSGILALVTATMPQYQNLASKVNPAEEEENDEVCVFTPKIMYPMPPPKEEHEVRPKKKVNEDLRREQYWGEILEKSVSYASIHRLSNEDDDEEDYNNDESDVAYYYYEDEEEYRAATKFGQRRIMCSGSLTEEKEGNNIVNITIEENVARWIPALDIRS